MAELDAELIAATALALVDAEGLAGFTMRGVAKALGVTPMALYHHVRNKAELATLVVDAANAEQPLPAPTGDWREDMWLMARSSRESMLGHPNVTALRRTYRVWTPAILQKTEHWVTLWLQSGLRRPRALRAAAASSMAILGLVEEESVLGSEQLPDDILLEARPNARLLLSFNEDPAALFEVAVRSMIDGLYERLKHK
ncbi:MAG: TetR family transcriptional regulator [Bacteroidales bacterium]|nr:TetR family transcriptional regulator [Bacteroidales bacterium]